MSIPAGTQTGQDLSPAWQGLPRHRQRRARGDQLVEVVIETPVNLDEEQRALLVEFADLSGDDVHPEKRSFFQRLKDLFD